MPDTPVFEKKWWEKNKPTLLGATGMGEALEAWQSACSEIPSKLSTREAFEAAFAAFGLLDKALTKTRAKAAKDKKVLGWCDWYEKEAAKYRSLVERNYEQRLARYTEDRNALLTFTAEASKAMNVFEQELAKLEKYLEATEEEADNDVRQNGGAMVKMYYEQAKQAYARIEQIQREAALRYESDGKYIKERRGGAYDAKSYGITEADAQKLVSLFYAATENTNKASAAYQAVKDGRARAEETFNTITQLFFGGRKSGETLLKDAEKLRDDCKNLIDQIVAEIKKTANALPVLKQVAESAKTGGVRQDQQLSVRAVMLKLEKHQSEIENCVQQMKLIVEKGLKRIPDELRKSNEFKPVLDRVKVALGEAASLSKSFGEQMVKAREQAKTVSEAKLTG